MSPYSARIIIGTTKLRLSSFACLRRAEALMNYRLDKHGRPISILGFGCMRFPQNKGKIDLAETEREILTVFHAGVLFRFYYLYQL